MSMGSAMLIQAEQLPWEPAGRGLRRKLLGYDPELMMVRVEFASGAIGTAHSHPHRQVTFIERGNFEVTIGKETMPLTAGDSFFVPPNVPHGVIALSEGCLIDVFTPVRQDFL
ncbi:MAG TPA: cupin domain-containing protein [Bacteroidota bacterium]|nr:cupin domain-containing protein [Bacteroidota bacterium]